MTRMKKIGGDIRYTFILIFCFFIVDNADLKSRVKKGGKEEVLLTFLITNVGLQARQARKS